MLTKIPKTIQSSEFRKNLSKYLKESNKEPVFVSTERGAGSSVLISAEAYNKLVDLYDTELDEEEREALAKGRKNFENGNFLTLHDVKSKLGITGR